MGHPPNQSRGRAGAPFLRSKGGGRIDHIAAPKSSESPPLRKKRDWRTRHPLVTFWPLGASPR